MNETWEAVTPLVCPKCNGKILDTEELLALVPQAMARDCGTPVLPSIGDLKK